MINESDMWRTAALLINRYGDDALLAAWRRAEQLGATGDVEGQRDWARILNAVNEFLSETHDGRLH